MKKTSSWIIAGILLTLTTALAASGGQGGQWFAIHDLGLKSIKSVVDLSETRIVVTDGIGGRAVTFDLPAGESVPPGKRIFSKPLKLDLNPYAAIKPYGTGYLQVILSEESGLPQRIDWFNRDLSRRSESLFLQKTGDHAAEEALVEDRVLGLYNWTVAGGDRVFAYGALESGLRDDSENREVPFKLGFFTFRLLAPGNADGVLRGELIETSREVHYYLLGIPYVAATGNQCYYLDMGTHPALYFYDAQISGRPIYLEGLPGSDELLPDINVNAEGFATFTRIENEGQGMPSGLFISEASQEGDESGSEEGGFTGVPKTALYLLRRPVSGQAEWTMTKLRPDPAGGVVEVLGSVGLGTRAPHLTVHFTKTSILVFERSSVRSQKGDQNVEGLWVYPRDLLRDLGR